MINELNEPPLESRERPARRKPAVSKSRTELANTFRPMPSPPKLPVIAKREAAASSAEPHPAIPAPEPLKLPDIGSPSARSAPVATGSTSPSGAEMAPDPDAEVDANVATSSAAEGGAAGATAAAEGNGSGGGEDGSATAQVAKGADWWPKGTEMPPPTPALMSLQSVGAPLQAAAAGGLGGPAVEGTPEVPPPPTDLQVKELRACLRCPMAKMKMIAAERTGRLARHHYAMLLPTGIIQMMLNLLDHEKPKSAVARTVVSAIAEMSVVVDLRPLVAPHSNKVVQTLTDGPRGSRERASLAIMNLAVDGACREIMLRHGAVPSLLTVLAEGSGKDVIHSRAVMYAAGALANLVSSDAVIALAAIKDTEGGVAALVAMLAAGVDNVATQRVGLVVARLKVDVPGAADEVRLLAEQMGVARPTDTPAGEKKTHPKVAGKKAYHPARVLH